MSVCEKGGSGRERMRICSTHSLYSSPPVGSCGLKREINKRKGRRMCWWGVS